jgi:hypothetical protein
MKINARGQTSDVFRLLVAAVLGLAILIIILGIVAVIEEQKFQLSELRFYDGFGHAVNLPTNQVFQEEKLVFKGKQMFTAESLSLQFKVEKECIQFETNNSRVHIRNPSNSGQIVEMANNIQIDVFFQCEYLSVPPGNCPLGSLFCKVLFGEKPAGTTNGTP